MTTILSKEEFLRLGGSKKIIYIDKLKSNIQSWIDSKVRLELDKYCLENQKKKQDVIEQAIILYLHLVLNDKLDEVIGKYLPKKAVEEK
jgi:hypothetical protein